jgi:hypothetical protein
LNLALGSGQANESFQQISSGGRALDEFASPGAHGAHDDLRLVETSDGEDGLVGEFLAQKFNGAHGGGGIVDWDIDQDNVGSGGLHSPGDGIGCCDRETGAGMNCAGYAGAIHQHLQHGALFIIGGYDDD